MPAARQVVLVSRAGCHLCEDAEALVDRACRQFGLVWQRVDVDADPDLLARYRDHVPVLLVDGVVLDYWTVEHDRLVAALRGDRVRPRPPL